MMILTTLSEDLYPIAKFGVESKKISINYLKSKILLGLRYSEGRKHLRMG